MPDRLTELKRQRALIAEHLQWLDREIVALDSPRSDALQTTPLVTPQTTAALPASPPQTAGTLPSGDDWHDPAITLLQESERQRGQISKSGCWIVFATLLLIGVGGITTYILMRYG